MRRIKPLNPRDKEFQSRRELKKFSQNQRDLYSTFNLFELKMSRLMNVPSFKSLVEEL